MSANSARTGYRAAVLAAAFALALLLAGCASAPRAIAGDPLAMLGTGASAYIVLPVEGNRKLVTFLSSALDPDGGLKKAFDRTSIAYIAAYPGGAFRIIATGSFSPATQPLVFSGSQGWKKMTGKKTGTWYRKGSVDASFPESGIACVVSGQETGMEQLLNGLAHPGFSPVTPDFEASYDARDAKGPVVIFVADAVPWVEQTLGPDISLPVDHAMLQAVKGSADYLVTARIVAPDVRTAKAMASLVRLAFPDIKPALEGTVIKIPEFPVSAEKLVNFAKNLYFVQ